MGYFPLPNDSQRDTQLRRELYICIACRSISSFPSISLLYSAISHMVGVYVYDLMSRHVTSNVSYIGTRRYCRIVSAAVILPVTIFNYIQTLIPQHMAHASDMISFA